MPSKAIILEGWQAWEKKKTKRREIGELCTFKGQGTDWTTGRVLVYNNDIRSYAPLWRREANKGLPKAKGKDVSRCCASADSGKGRQERYKLWLLMGSIAIHKILPVPRNKGRHLFSFRPEPGTRKILGNSLKPLNHRQIIQNVFLLFSWCSVNYCISLIRSWFLRKNVLIDYVLG